MSQLRGTACSSPSFYFHSNITLVEIEDMLLYFLFSKGIEQNSFISIDLYVFLHISCFNTRVPGSLCVCLSVYAGRVSTGCHAALISLRLTHNWIHWAQTPIVNWMDNNMSALWAHDHVLYDKPKPSGAHILQIGNLVTIISRSQSF